MYPRKPRLMWHFNDDNREFEVDPFKKKSKFHPKEVTAIEMYLSRLEEENLSFDEKITYSNLTKEGRNALYLLRYDASIIIKKADKGSTVVLWDREDFLREANRKVTKTYIQKLKVIQKVLL